MVAWSFGSTCSVTADLNPYEVGAIENPLSYCGLYTLRNQEKCVPWKIILEKKNNVVLKHLDVFEMLLWSSPLCLRECMSAVAVSHKR